MCFVWRNSETFVRMGLRNCQQEWLRGDLVDPLNQGKPKTQSSSLCPWRQRVFPPISGDLQTGLRQWNVGMWAGRGPNCAGGQTWDTPYSAWKPLRGSGLWALWALGGREGNKRGPSTHIGVSKGLQPEEDLPWGSGVLFHIPAQALSSSFNPHHDLQRPLPSVCG